MRAAFVFGLLSGGALYLAWVIWAGLKGRGSPAPPPLSHVLQKGDRCVTVGDPSPTRHVVAALFAAAGPLAWPVLGMRYGWARGTGCAVGAWAVHVGIIALAFNSGWLPVAMLGVPVLYAAAASALARRDGAWRLGSLRRQGWVYAPPEPPQTR